VNFLSIQVETDKGRVRAYNEDFAGYFHLGDSELLVVCDGMGGHAAGDVASRLAVMAISEYVEAHYVVGEREKIPLILKEAFDDANRKIYEEGLKNPHQKGMGTTCVMTIVTQDCRVYYAHVGDSRLYWYSEGELKLMTKDHTFVQELVDHGAISEQEARSHPNRNLITRALGVDPSVKVDVGEQPFFLKKTDLLLLCTDGLNTMLSDEEIARVIETVPREQVASTLLKLANEAGGYDNITLIVAYPTWKTNHS
jgi:protein phosphatase